MLQPLRSITLPCLLALAVLTLGGCGDDSPTEVPDMTSDTSSADATDTSGGDTSGGDTSVDEDTSTPPDVCDTTCSADAEDTSVDDTTQGDVEPDTTDTTMQLELPPQPWDVFERGHYNVGYEQTTISYVDGTGQTREIGLDIWYPSLDTSGTRVSYIILMGLDGVYYSANPAPVPTDTAGFPLMIFSHGSGGFPAQSYFWTEYLATHGWIVAATEHVGNTTSDGGDIPPEILFQRPQDVTAALDFMLETDVDGTGLDALIDAEQVAVSGHSFGGYTSLAVAGATYQVALIEAGCSAGQVPETFCTAFTMYRQLFVDGFLDERVDTIVPMSPGATVVFGAGMADIDTPVMLMTGTMDMTTPDSQDGDPTWTALDGTDDLRVRFETGGHFTFSNACDLAASLGEDDGCGDAFIPDDEAHTLINAYGLAFLRRSLGLPTDADAEALLDPATSLRDDVVLVAPEL